MSLPISQTLASSGKELNSGWEMKRLHVARSRPTTLRSLDSILKVKKTKSKQQQPYPTAEVLCRLVKSKIICYWLHNPHTSTMFQSCISYAKWSLSTRSKEENEFEIQSKPGQQSNPKERSRSRANFVQFTPIPMTYTKLLQSLPQNTLVVTGSPNPLQPTKTYKLWHQC